MNYTNYPIEKTVGKFMYKVYGWMSFALFITAAIAYLVGTSSLFAIVAQNTFLFWMIIIAEFGLVIYLSSAILKIDYSTAAATFITYSVLNGITLSFIFYIYTASSIYSSFIISAGMFAGMALYGYVTKANLTSMGNMAFMLLWGIILGRIVNMFMHSSQMEYILSFAGVIIFCLLTAYDVQKIKKIYMQLQGSGQDLSKVAIIGALTLYLDFINLFLNLLRLTGKRRN